jgi:hypothetical protein
MGYDTRGNDRGTPRRSPRALGHSQPDPWVRRYPWVGLVGVRRDAPAELAAVVARRRGVRAPECAGAERPGLLREAGAGAALAGGGVSGRAGGGGGPGRGVLPTGGGGQRAGSGPGGGGPAAGPPTRRGGGCLVAGEQRRVRRGALAAGVAVAAVQPGLDEARNAGRAVQHDAAGAGDGSSAGWPRGGCRGRRGPALSECGRPTAGDGLGVDLARWRAGRRPAARPSRPAAGGASRSGLAASPGAPLSGRAGGR